MTVQEDKSLLLEVFDPPMCCSSGVCGPQVDQKLVQFGADLEWLRIQGIQVERYNPNHHYAAFLGNATVAKMVNDCGTGCLPLVLLNGKITGHSRYPSRAELAAMIKWERANETSGS